VCYLLVGGYALAAHSHPRYTKDLGVWIDRDPANADNLILALSQFGFDSLGLTCEDFLQEGQVIQLGYPPARIDILTSADGVDFRDCYAKHSTVTIDGVDVTLIDVESLCKNKLASGRTQDLADVEILNSQTDKADRAKQ
jgi:hypothetical protein